MAIVDLFAKVILAVAILVANGALLFFILRFLLWLAFPASKQEAGVAAVAIPPAAAGTATVAALGAGAATAATSPSVPVTPPVPGEPPVFIPSAPRPRAYPHRLLIGVPVILSLFAGGVWLGTVVGGSGDAAAATRVITVHGKVVTVNATKTELRVPSTRVRFKKGSVVTVPAQTLLLPRKTVVSVQTRTRVLTLPGTTSTVTTTYTIPPTTVFETGTTVTVTETNTQTVTTTDTTGTTTTT